MLLYNEISPLSFGNITQYTVLDVFSAFSGQKKIILEAESNVVYVTVLDNSSIDFDIQLVGEGARLEFFGIFVGDVSSKVLTQLLANSTFSKVYLYCVVKEQSSMSVDGNVVIAKDKKGVECSLVEEQFLLGNPKHLLVRPLLDVHSHQVKASHGAKIHTLDQQKLFYMMAKGLSLQEAQKIVIEASLQSVFDRVDSVDTAQKQELFQKLLKSLFTPLDIVG